MINEERGGRRDIQSLHRAFDVLEVLGRERDLGVTQIARATGLPVSTVHNLLRTMANRKYVVGTRGRYALGPAMVILTSQWDPVASLSRVVHDYVERVIDDTGHTAFASVIVARHVRVIAYKMGHGLVTVNENHEDNPDALSIATGRLLIAMSPESDWDEWIDIAGEERGSKNGWHEQLRTIANCGVCVRVLPEEDPHVCVIAVPVWGGGGQVLCSIASGIPLYVLTTDMVERAVGSLWSAASSLSAAFGCSSMPMARPDLTTPGLRELARLVSI